MKLVLLFFLLPVIFTFCAFIATNIIYEKYNPQHNISKRTLTITMVFLLIVMVTSLFGMAYLLVTTPFY